VNLQALGDFRTQGSSVGQLKVRNKIGQMVPLATLASVKSVGGPVMYMRYNMYPSAELNGDGPPGTSSGVVLAAVQETARAELPRGFAIDWAGISRDELSAGNQGLVVALIALLFVYLVLAGQYESVLLPAVILLSLPPGLFGALLCLHWSGLENNVYTHIALVVLIGLLGKNAILIVEFAEHGCRSGQTPLSAVLEAARLRLRPILMTSFAFVMGLVPLVLARGAGAVANRTIGTATIGGMLLGTAAGVALVPGLYLIAKDLQAWSRTPSARTQPTDEPAFREPQPPADEPSLEIGGASS